MTESGRATIWLAATGIAALATWICFDAIPGINWPIWTAAAVGALVFIARTRPGSLPLVAGAGTTAIVLAGAAAIFRGRMRGIAHLV